MHTEAVMLMVTASGAGVDNVCWKSGGSEHGHGVMRALRRASGHALAIAVADSWPANLVYFGDSNATMTLAVVFGPLALCQVNRGRPSISFQPRPSGSRLLSAVGSQKLDSR